MDEMAKKIHELRKSKGMTLEDLGNAVGVGKSTVRKWETGDIANMKRDKIAKVANALGVTPAYLMGWTEEEAAPSNNAALDAELLYKFNKLTEPRKRSVLQVIDALLDVQDN